jgi:hypothetical protein
MHNGVSTARMPGSHASEVRANRARTANYLQLQDPFSDELAHRTTI